MIMELKGLRIFLNLITLVMVLELIFSERFVIAEVNSQLHELNKCPQNLPLLKVLPGRGWCNLRNKEMNQVQSFSYQLCKTTPDGLFLIPDNVFIIPQLESNVQLYAEIIDSWKNFTSVTSKSINVNGDASFGSALSISGSYGEDYQTCKQTQFNNKAVTTRVAARYNEYTVVTSVDESIDPHLLIKLQRVIDAMKANKDEEVDYLLELIVREYGTHLITRIDAGALINQEEYITRSYRAEFDNESEVIKAAASARLFERIGFGASYTTTANESMIKTYENNLRASHTHSFGGMLFKPNMSINEWVESIPKNLVPIDREGDSLHFIVTPSSFPDESLEIVDTLRLKWQGATGRYYAYNKHVGCMDPGSKNFEYNANVDNNACNVPWNNYTFGGVFQTCSQPKIWWKNVCPDLEHRNILTQNFSCPTPYVPIPLMTVKMRTHCNWWWWWRWECEEFSYTPHWCVRMDTVQENTGLMFGGIFTSKMNNPLTETKSCPPTFIDAMMFDDLHICIGNEYELGSKFAAEFGGFFSCQKGNPLYNLVEVLKRSKSNSTFVSEFPDLDNQTTKACPPGYSQHTAIVQYECLVSYCVKAGSFALYGEMPVILPPFKNYTGIFSVIGDATNTGSGTTGLVIAVVGLSVLLVTILLVIVGRAIWKKRVSARMGGYNLVNNTPDTETVGENIQPNELDDENSTLES